MTFFKSCNFLRFFKISINYIEKLLAMLKLIKYLVKKIFNSRKLRLFTYFQIFLVALKVF